MKTSLSHSIAAAGTAVICLLAFTALTADRSSAFTVIERQLSFDPVEITVDQTAHIVVNNTFGSQAIHITINWSDAVSGAPIGSAFDADLAPGHGAIALLPAVQTPVNTTPGTTRAIIAVLKLSATPGVAAFPIVIGPQLTGALDVVDSATGHVGISHGFFSLPAVQ